MINTIQGLDDKKSNWFVFNQSKAFGIVDHILLLKKLEFYGIRDSEFLWFKSCH